EPPKSLLLGIGVMTLGSSSCAKETLVTVLVVCEGMLAYGILVTRRGSCTRRHSCSAHAFTRVRLTLRSRGHVREYLVFVKVLIFCSCRQLRGTTRKTSGLLDGI
ncbi:hypothetical protein A2U01_0056353, partial [Trifolium medium]|nr:hypothetical protein [Trifolium medium]